MAHNLYVPLDVDYAADEKVLAAGPMAELLYVRSLAFAKRTLSDGLIRTAQLPLVGINIPNLARCSDKLVEVGLWVFADDGWLIVGWTKRNKSAQTVRSESEQKRLASQKANHDRWHSDGKVSARCPFCDPIRIGSGLRPESTEPKPETEPETDSRSPLALVPPEPGFDEFWTAYPKKADKGAARRAWTTAAKKADPQHIVEAATRYSHDPRREDRYTKNPASWLNAEAWDNPYPKASGDGVTYDAPPVRYV